MLKTPASLITIMVLLCLCLPLYFIGAVLHLIGDGCWKVGDWLEEGTKGL